MTIEITGRVVDSKKRKCAGGAEVEDLTVDTATVDASGRPTGRRAKFVNTVCSRREPTGTCGTGRCLRTFVYRPEELVITEG